MHRKIKKLCSSENPKFILAYHNQPDHISHNSGCRSRKLRRTLKKINRRTKSLCRKLKDTLVIISADHGHIDIDNYFYLEEFSELNDCLLRPPSIESRAVSIFVKPGTNERFRTAFERILGSEFILFSKDEIFEKKLFGVGKPHPKSLDFIGDFIAVAKGTSLLMYRTPDQKVNKYFLSHHAGLTGAEMAVPLILIEKQ
jgi:predicted AlkP superfamily pyrophosphatase or phosphodiesterase